MCGCRLGKATLTVAVVVAAFVIRNFLFQFVPSLYRPDTSRPLVVVLLYVESVTLARILWLLSSVLTQLLTGNSRCIESVDLMLFVRCGCF